MCPSPTSATGELAMSLTLQSILGDEALAAFEAPGPVAKGLPAAAYTSDSFLALENERLFAASWVFAGLAHELARPGDVVPVSVAGKPVLLVRDADAQVRSFHNVCRHRCLKLVDEPCNVGPAHPVPLSLLDLQARRHAPPRSLLWRARPARGAQWLRPRGARAGAGAGGDLARLDIRQPERRRSRRSRTSSPRSRSTWAASTSPG